MRRYKKESWSKVNASSKMNLKQNRIFVNYFIWRFNCCPLFFMFHNKTIKKKIDSPDERYLRVAYNDMNLSVRECLTTEMFKLYRNLTYIIVGEIIWNWKYWLHLASTSEFFLTRCERSLPKTLVLSKPTHDLNEPYSFGVIYLDFSFSL